MALQCVPGFVIEKDLQHALADGSGDTVLDEGLVLEGQTITSLRAGFYVSICSISGNPRKNNANLCDIYRLRFFERSKDL